MAKQTANYGRRWYAIHTYSGFEENVRDSLMQRIETLDMKEKIFAILVPKEKKIKLKNGQRKVVEEKIFPGYVLVEMIVTDDSWYVVRNTPNVTGFVDTGHVPTPIPQEEIDALMKLVGNTEPEYKVDLHKNDTVQITDGPFKGQQAKVEEVDHVKGQAKVMVTMFGRETALSIDFLQIKKI
ncbi:MAG: transcription termination/antitermination protein NusG [Patescibacteria group bacterium]